MTFKLNFPMTNPALPADNSAGEAILALSGLVEWWQAESDAVDLSVADIVTWRSLKSGGRALTQANTAKRAALTADQINHQAAALFDRTAGDNYSASSAHTATGALAYLIVFKPTLDATAQGVLGMFASSASRFYADLTTTAGALAGRCGTASVFGNFLINDWNVLILEKDSSNFQLRCKGVSSAVTAHNNDTSASTLTVGAISPTVQPMAGLISDVMVFGQRILADTPAMAAINAYLSGIYGLTA
jgi:hypothetical protein